MSRLAPDLTRLLAVSILLATFALPTAASGTEMLLADTRQLTFEGRRAGEGYFSADGSRMVFQSERDAENPFYQIYLLDLETGDTERVSPGYGKTTCAWIHPRDRRILFASTHEDPDTRSKMRDELDFRASGQERRYAWDYDEQFELYAQDLDTGTRTNLTNALGYDAEGSYSPDGRRIAFASNRRAFRDVMTPAEAEIFEVDKSFMMDIYLMNADGSEVRQLTHSPGYDGGPFFSPDGSHITWRRFSEDGATAEIFTMNLATGEEQRLTSTGVMSWAPYYHPSGDYLIYASNQEGFANFELYLVDTAGQRDPVRVTESEGFDGLPVFSPDGNTLAWTSNRTAARQSQIFLAKWNDALARELLALDSDHADRAAADSHTELDGTSPDITSDDARRHLNRLTAAPMEGRLTGTEGERNATAYVAELFAEFGLQPGGDDGGYFQYFPFTAGASLGADNTLTISGVPLDGPPRLDQDWRPLALSKNGDTESADVVFAGYGIVAPEQDGQPAYDAYADLDVSGKWVMMLRYQPEDVTAEARRHLLRFSSLGFKAAWARRKGALGVIVVTGPNAASNSELVKLNVGSTTETTSLAAISISDALAANLLEVADQELAQLQTDLDSGSPFTGFTIPDVQVSATLQIERQTSEGRNVIGILPAAGDTHSAPAILGAHVDHLGRGQAGGSLAREEEQGEIHPGADDNASGVAGMLEAAQYLTGLATESRLGAKRDIWFVAWSGEELGTLGSTHFVDTFADGASLKGRVSAYLNLDMIGRLEEKLYLQGTGSSPIWAREIERRNVPIGLAITTSSDPYLPTDSTPFYLKKVPVLAAFTGVHEEYSTPRDVPALINFDGIRDVSRLMAGITRSIARADELPEFVEVTREDQSGGRAVMRVYLGTIPAYGEDEGVVGVRLQGAVKGSPAESAGVMPGDVLVGLDNVEIETIYDFMTALSGLKAGEETTMTVNRSGSAVELSVTPGSRD